MASKTGRTWLDCKKPKLADEFLSFAVKVSDYELVPAFEEREYCIQKTIITCFD